MRNPAASSSAQEFSWWPIGGLGEVGMNCMVFLFGKEAVPVDAGILFADPNDFGIEAIYPDYRPFILEHRPRFWLITHGHEDHIGAVGAVLEQFEECGVPLPLVYAPPFATELIKERLLDPEKIRGGARYLERLRTVAPDSSFTLDGASGPIEVHYMETRHSTPDTCSLAFHWKSKESSLRIVHTSDFKLDAHEFEDGVKDVRLYDVFKGIRPDFLFIDSTNAERDGHSVSETEIVAGLETLIEKASGRIYVTLFSSNVHRIAKLMQLARKTNRFVCLAGRSLQSAFEKATLLGMPGRNAPEVGEVKLLAPQDINRHPPHSQFIICSGSQGENRSTLMRLSQGLHADFMIEPGDSVIFSSKTIPGNDKGISRVINGLIRQGAEVLSGDFARVRAVGPIHASGHARRDEIRAVAALLKPHHCVPVHGELRQLSACSEVLLEAGEAWGLKKTHVHIVENGTRLRFRAANDSPSSESPWFLSEREKPAEALPRMLRFERYSASSRDAFLKVRKKAAQGGVVSAWIDSTGRVGSETRGLVPDGILKSPYELNELAEKWLASQYRRLVSQRAFNGRDVELENSLAEDLARHLRRLTGVRPFSIVHLIGL